jgi:hypothetical protein
MRLNRTAITGEDGRFMFFNLPSGRFTVTASKAGFPPVSFGAKHAHRTGSGVMIGEGQQLAGIDIKLAKGGVLSGTVYDDRGEPMPGVPMMPWEVRTTLGGERTFDFPRTGGAAIVTDDRGRYRIFGLPPGEYTVGTAWFYASSGSDVRVPTDTETRAAFSPVPPPTSGAFRPGSSSPAQAQDQAPRFSYSRVFYPNVVDPLTATVMSLAAGQERDGLDIQMQFRPMSKIEATITGPNGPARDVRVALFRKSAIQSLTSTTYSPGRPDGRFTSGSLAPGDYTVMAALPAQGGEAALWASADITIAGAEPIKVALMLQPGMTITGRVVFDGSTLKPPSDLSRARVALLPLAGTSAMNSAVMSPVDAAGAFSITGVTPGRFRLVPGISGAAAARPGEPVWSARSVHVDGRDVTDLPIDIVPGSAPAMTVTFTDQVSELSGTLITPSNQQASDYFVVVLAADRQYWTPLTKRIVSTRPDARGRYVFHGLPSGEYRIAVTTDLVPDDLSNARALTELAAQSVAFTIGPGEKKTVDVKIGQ